MVKSIYMKFFLLGLIMAFSNVHALDVKLTPEREFVEAIHKNKLIKVQRIQDQKHVLEGGFAKTSRKCPPFCIEPMIAGAGVQTVGQLEIFDFMENELLGGEGFLIDARTPAWWKRGTIPGSINIPFTVFSLADDDPKLIDAMKVVGAKRRGEIGLFSRVMEGVGLMGDGQKNSRWDFSNAKKLIIWCNGMWCSQSPRAVRSLLKMGYPAEKIFYYRGGMQVWQTLGLTIVEPE